MPNLRFARRKIESFMTDAITIAYDPEGSSDDTIDYGSGDTVQPSEDFQAIYDETSVGAPTDEHPNGRPLGHHGGIGGICFVDPAQAVRSVALQVAGGANLTAVPYEIWLPIDGPNLGPGAVGKINYTEEDPWMVDREFVVRHVTYGTLEPMRIVIAEERGARVPG